MFSSNEYLRRAQALSGVAFAIFLSMHLLNTALALIGQEAYDAFQKAAREFYQLPFVEMSLLAAALTAHVWASAALALRRRRAAGAANLAKTPPVSLRLRLHRWSAYCLLLIIFIHVAAIRLPALMAGLSPDFSFIHFTFYYWPWFFYPYYFLFAVSAVYHLVNGLFTAIGAAGWPGMPRMEHRRPFWAIFAAASLLVTLGIFSLGGNIFPVDKSRFPEFQAFYDRHYPGFMLPWKN